MGTGNVIVAVEDSPRAWWHTRWAASYASGAGATLELISCWRPGQLELRQHAAEGLRFVAPEDAARERLQLLLDRLRAEDPAAAVTLTLACGRVSDALVEASAHACLLVLGSRERSRWARALSGSTSRRVARLARCPVVAVTGRPLPSGAGRVARVRAVTPQ